MKKIILGAGMLLLAGQAMAQDIHQTQYFSSPLTLNPALTGLTRCDLRVAANYRSQWYTVSSTPYMTGILSYDMATLKGKLGNGDALGVGILATYDKSGAGALTGLNVGLSVAYHKAFGSDKQHTISLGVQGGLVQKSIDFTKLTFEDQFDPANGYAAYATGENLQNGDLSYPDFNAGLMYSGRLSEHATAYAGISAYHLTEPQETFLSGSNKVHRRYTATLGGAFNLNENMVLYASGMYQSQANASEVIIGAATGFILNPGHDQDYQENTILYLGGWYRYGDAISPYIGLEWTKMIIGISYDVNLSGLTPASNAQGAYEFSLTFNGCMNKSPRGPKYNFSCPRF